VKLPDFTTLPCKARLLDPAPSYPPRVPPIRERKTVPTSWLELTLTEGKNRQVRRMTAAVGYPTLRLIRVDIGNLRLGDLHLEPGKWRELRSDEYRHVLAQGS
jgi:23S rRNA pseudouridine2457 synthase